jgi:hypothetical protein
VLSTQALFAELTGGASTAGGTGSGAQTQQASGQYGGAYAQGSLGAGNIQNLLAMMTTGDSGATSNVTDNANGSTTTTITYANGSTLSMTSAASSTSSATASSSSTGSDSSTTGSGSSSGTSNVVASNLIEQMIQIQAALVNQTSTQSTTA